MKSIPTSKKWKIPKLNPIKLFGREEREHYIKYPANGVMISEKDHFIINII